MITLPCRAEVELEHRVDFVRATADGSLVAASATGEITLLSPALEPRRRWSRDEAIEDLDLSADGTLLLEATETEVRLVEVRSQAVTCELPHRRGGGACLTAGADAVWVATSDDDLLEVSLYDLRGTRLRGTEITAPTSGCTCRVYSPPAGGAMLWAAAGQDGQWLFRLRDDGRALSTDALPLDQCSPPIFDPAGEQLLVTVDETTLARFRLQSLARVGDVTDWPFAADDALSDPVAWVAADRALVSTDEGSLWLVDVAAMRALDEVVVTRPSGERLDQRHWSTAVGPSSLLSVHWETSSGRFRASRLALVDIRPLFSRA